MAGSWNAVITEINDAIAAMSEAASRANAAANEARQRAQEAQEAADAAQAEADNAKEIAEEASELAGKWNNATVEAVTLDPGADATLEIKEKGGVKHLIFGVPRGLTGEAGQDGATGESGVEFELDGTTLYIKRTT